MHEKQFTKTGNTYNVNTYVILPWKVEKTLCILQHGQHHAFTAAAITCLLLCFIIITQQQNLHPPDL
jgi:hypothetical protein